MNAARARVTLGAMGLGRSTAGLAMCLLLAHAADAVGAASADQPPPPASQEIMYSGEATGILGRSVHGPDGDPVGRIVDVLVDDQGQPRAAVIDFGGFMGIGKRRVAVAWRALRFLPAAQQYQVRIEMTVDQIRETPEFKAAKPLDPPLTMAAPPPALGMPALGK